MAILNGSRSPVWSVALSDDGGVLASGGDDGVVRVWDPSMVDTRDRCARAPTLHVLLDIHGAPASR